MISSIKSGTSELAHHSKGHLSVMVERRCVGRQSYLTVGGWQMYTLSSHSALAQLVLFVNPLQTLLDCLEA